MRGFSLYDVCITGVSFGKLFFLYCDITGTIFLLSNFSVIFQGLPYEGLEMKPVFSLYSIYVPSRLGLDNDKNYFLLYSCYTPIFGKSPRCDERRN